MALNEPLPSKDRPDGGHVHRQRSRLDGADFEPAGFFLLRTPLLAFDELASWGDELSAPALTGRDPGRGRESAGAGDLEEALRRDRRALRPWLRDLLERPEVIEALLLASPGLVSALDYWRRDPDGKKGRRAEEALVRYAVRMTSRATPFGLFAGCTLGSVGSIGDATELLLEGAEHYRRHSRLDMDYLFSVAHELHHDPALRRALTYRPSSSLYRAAGRLRYAESRLDDGVLTYHLVAVEPNEYLDIALERAAEGATVDELAAVLVASDPDGEIERDDAEGFVDELIESQILVSELWPAVTGPEAVDGLIETLARTGHGAAEPLRAARRSLRRLDGEGLGHAPARYGEIARVLDALPREGRRRHLYQVDLLKPGRAVLGVEVADEVARGIEVLHRFAGPDPGEALDSFRERFLDRYDQGRMVPLVEALDEEVGIGMPAGGIGADASPLLAGLAFPGAGGLPGTPGSPGARGGSPRPWGPSEELLLAKLTRALATGADEIEITDEDLDRLAGRPLPPLADSFQAMVKIAAPSDEALAAGDFEVWVKNVFGPSGARIAGRFCHADEALAGQVTEHLRAEEALDPDVLFAEVAHLPSGRVGNVVARPLLREWEIPFLGVSGAPRDRQIPIEDLLVTVAGDEVILVSRRHGRRVEPRLTSAHNYVVGSLAVYRFLGTLQGQGRRIGLTWSWGPFDGLPFVPRVRSGRVVLSHARWRVTPEEIATLAARRGAERFRAVRRWRDERGIPRRVLLADDDSELYVDFDNVLSLDSFLPAARERDEILLTELWPRPEDLITRGPEGRFCHEIVVPFERRRAPTRRRGMTPAGLVNLAGAAVERAARTLGPTSHWLYLKIFTGASTADLILRDVVGPLVTWALDSGAAERWFFLRYGDPHWHLRVRFGGEPDRLRAIVERCGDALGPALGDGRIWRWQLDTYEREIERYGGLAGVEVAERIFHADSDAVLSVLAALEGDGGADERWRLAFVGIDRMLADFGLDLGARRDTLADLRASFAAEFDVGDGFKQQLAGRLRSLGDELDGLLAGDPDWLSPALEDGLAAFARRSDRLRPLVGELRALESRGALSLPMSDLVPSYVHLFVNRLVRADQRAHELVLYDLLHRITLSRIAREAAGRAAPTR